MLLRMLIQRVEARRGLLELLVGTQVGLE